MTNQVRRWSNADFSKELKLITGFPFDSKKFNDEQGMPLIRIRNLQESSIDIYYNGDFHEQYIIYRNDILIGMDGDFHIVKWKNIDALLNQRIIKLELQSESKMNLDFTYFLLKPILSGIHAITPQTTVKHLSVKDLYKITILVPKIEEQEKIAEILTTVDNSIEKTETLIEKYKNVKQGMMQDLLTKGIDEHGNIRSEETHEFKDSPIGRIPKEWDIGFLGKICRDGGGSVQTGPFGSQLHAEDYKDEGVPIITVEHLDENRIVHRNLPLVGAQDYVRLSKYTLKEGDLVFSRVGSVDRCAYVRAEEDGWLFSGRCLRVRTGTSMNAQYLSYQLNFSKAKNWILNHAVGSTMACLNTTILSGVPIMIPIKEEQRAIAEKLQSIDYLINREQEILEKYKKLKQGLMHDLLTGKVRVSLEEESG